MRDGASVDDVLEMVSQPVAALVVEAFDACVLDGAVYPFDLSLRPWGIECCELVVDAVVFGAMPWRFARDLTGSLDYAASLDGPPPSCGRTRINLAQSASFYSKENNLPAKFGIKRLGGGLKAVGVLIMAWKDEDSRGQSEDVVWFATKKGLNRCSVASMVC